MTKNAHSPAEIGSPAPVVNLGLRLKEARLRSGLSLREVARRLSVSPSFVSQMENGKSQPSVATLYAMASLFAVSIDVLFGRDVANPSNGAASALSRSDEPVSRSDFSSPADAWVAGERNNLAVVRPGERPRLVMDSGVIWEQLAADRARELDFMEICYPPGSSSTSDGRMLRHEGMEYGYLMEGQLEVTYGFHSVTLSAGESICFDSSLPHLLTNKGDEVARGIWVVHHHSRVRRQDTTDPE